MQYTSHMLRHVRRTVGQNIHSRRCNRKLTLGKLAKLCCIPEARLDRYEIGGDEINLRELLKIACALDVDLRKLICE